MGAQEGGGAIIISECLFLLWFLSAVHPTDQGEESVLVVVVVVEGFGGTVFGSPMYTQYGCIQRKLPSGYIQRKLLLQI